MNSSLEMPFSSAEMLDQNFVNHKPRLSFDGGTFDAWQDWRKRLLPELRELLGPFPNGASPLSPRVVSTEAFDMFTLHRVIYHSQPNVPIPAYLLIPKNVTEKTPAVLCIHGHVPGGKESVVFGDGELGAPYGRKLAEQGVITLCPDNAGMGERAHPSGGCDFLWRRLNYLGHDLTGYRVYDLMRGIDYLRSLAEVDETRIGIAGLSGGCWLGIVHAALDDRIQAAVLSGYFTTFAQTSWFGHCICHHPKAIGELCEMPDIAGLIAPRPIFVEWGTQDVSRPVQPAFEMAQKIYRAADAEDDIRLHEFDAGHLFSGERSLPWLVQTLSRQ
ncbi:MAG: acetylxylan esterase [Candidatus Poribacteria bacterium]|nr:acetylxylan esterase [Candidatus Poribacteria bacterium]